MASANEQRFIDYVMLRLDVDPYARQSWLTEEGATLADVSVATARAYIKKMITGPLCYANIRGDSNWRSRDHVVARKDRVDWEYSRHLRTDIAWVRDR